MLEQSCLTEGISCAASARMIVLSRGQTNPLVPFYISQHGIDATGIKTMEPEFGKEAVELAQLWDQLALILFFQVSIETPLWFCCSFLT